MIYDELRHAREQEDPNRFANKARKLVEQVHKEKTKQNIDGQTYVVWFSKVLKNWKALVSTDAVDGVYYEVTYDGDNEVAYVDAYQKTSNTPVYDKF